MSFDAALDLHAPLPFDVAPALRGIEPCGDASLEQHDRHSPRRAELEALVRTQFLLHFGAHVRHFMPKLLALPSRDGGFRAVVGCRAAATERLFLETYTRAPVEVALAERHGIFVPRERIVEIGSLACRNAAAAIAIVRALVPYLLGARFTWVVFTGADTVMNVFRHLGLAPNVLCPADPLLLGAARHEWGSYYEHHPYVMAGRIEDGFRAAARAIKRSAS